MAKYADEARQRIQLGLKRFGPIIAQARSRSMNEADTRDIVKAILGDILGFDPFFEVTGEYSVKGQFADFAVKIEDQVRVFVEVKAIETKLEEKHLFQVIGYAANHGIEWAVLTNGDTWRIYRLFAGDSKRTEFVASVTLSDSNCPGPEKVEILFLISREGFRQNALGNHWENLQALHPQRVARCLIEDAVITAIRRELQRVAKFRIADSAVRDVLLNSVIRGDLSDAIKTGSRSKSPRAVKPSEKLDASPPT